MLSWPSRPPGKPWFLWPPWPPSVSVPLWAGVSQGEWRPCAQHSWPPCPRPALLEEGACTPARAWKRESLHQGHWAMETTTKLLPSFCSAPPAARLTAAPGDPLTREHCDLPVTKGAFHGSCSGRVGTSGLLWRLHWAQRPQPSPETNPLWDCPGEPSRRQRTEMIHKALISLSQKSCFLLGERLPVDGRIYGVSGFGRI